MNHHLRLDRVLSRAHYAWAGGIRYLAQRRILHAVAWMGTALKKKCYVVLLLLLVLWVSTAINRCRYGFFFPQFHFQRSTENGRWWMIKILHYCVISRQVLGGPVYDIGTQKKNGSDRGLTLFVDHDEGRNGGLVAIQRIFRWLLASGVVISNSHVAGCVGKGMDS